jgi:hypothetical protein
LRSFHRCKSGRSRASSPSSRLETCHGRSASRSDLAPPIRRANLDHVAIGVVAIAAAIEAVPDLSVERCPFGHHSTHRTSASFGGTVSRPWKELGREMAIEARSRALRSLQPCAPGQFHVPPRMESGLPFVTSRLRRSFAPTDRAYLLIFSNRTRFASSAHAST